MSAPRSSKNYWRRAGRIAAALWWIAVPVSLSALAMVSVAEPLAYRLATEVPEPWRDYAHQLLQRFAERIGSSSNAAGRLAQEMAGHSGENGETPRTVMVAAWISPEGKITRLEFEGLNGSVAAQLRAVLTKGEVGLPPPDMLQPIRLRLALRPKQNGPAR